MTKNVILFDFDGVIVNSIPLSYSINKATTPNLELEEWKGWFEGNIYKTINSELANETFYKSFFEDYKTGILEINPVDGIVDVINKLSDNNILIIISSSAQESIIAYLDKHNLTKHFTDILGMETHKSKVFKLNMVLDEYKINANDTLIITDTIGDIKEANKVGVKTLGVTWGVHNADKLAQISPNYIAAKPDDIITGIEYIFGLNN